MDKSNGWESVADNFIKARSLEIGVETIDKWAKNFAPGTSILDLGCGFGEPVSKTLIKNSLKVYAVDASQTLVSEFRKRYPYVAVACETVEESAFFKQTFDGIVAIGLMFLLSKQSQMLLIKKVSEALNPNGRFLFTCPYQDCSWTDIQTGLTSVSFGKKEYVKEFAKTGLLLNAEYTEEGGNHHFEFIKNEIEETELALLPEE